MEDSVLYLGVDGGGTGCRARLADRSGRALGEAQAGPANIRFGLDAAFREIEAAVAGACRAAGLREDVLRHARACLGLAGATEAGAREAARARPHGFADLAVTSDAHAACVGAHGGRDGGIVIVGTGTCGFAAVGGAGMQVGGRGFPLSDEGSGAWIGAELLRRALLAQDGRHPEAPCLDAALGRFGGEPGRVSAWMAGAKPRDYAALAPLAVEGAAAGDPEAEAILQGAARHVDGIAARLAELGAPCLALVGGLAPFIGSRVSDATRARLVEAQGDALDGALRLARELLG